jgi:Uma2 family endonuclease
MDDVIVKPRVRLTFAHFEAFRDARPKLEKWELIDGDLIMMPPPALVHQRICKNIETMLSARLSSVRPQWEADREIGVHIPEDDDYCPEPDVTVIDRDIALGQVYAERFYFVVEVLSKDRTDVLDKKRAYYQRHAHCRGFLFVSQKEISAELVVRTLNGWRAVILTGPLADIDIPDIGMIGRLGQAYRSTPLQPQT